jgi:hypothetical protein
MGNVFLGARAVIDRFQIQVQCLASVRAARLKAATGVEL